MTVLQHFLIVKRDHMYAETVSGPYQGGQAQYLRVPFADFNCLKLPPGKEHEADFALLADIFPTG